MVFRSSERIALRNFLSHTLHTYTFATIFLSEKLPVHSINSCVFVVVQALVFNSKRGRVEVNDANLIFNKKQLVEFTHLGYLSYVFLLDCYGRTWSDNKLCMYVCL